MGLTIKAPIPEDIKFNNSCSWVAVLVLVEIIVIVVVVVEVVVVILIGSRIQGIQSARELVRFQLVAIENAVNVRLKP